MKRILFIFCLCMAVLSLSFFVQPSYAQQTGTVRVDITPAGASSNGALWRVGNGSWLMSGAHTTVPLGRYQLEFKEAYGFAKPANQEVFVQSPTNYTLTATYRRLEGAVTVIIQPAQVVETRQPKWSGTWDGIKHVAVLGGERIDHIRAGSQSVKFEDVAGGCWFRPQDQAVTIVDGQAATVTGTYRGVCGWVSVKIEPQEAIQAGATWRVFGRPWRNSGDKETIAFNAGEQWNTSFSGIEIAIPAGWRVVSLPQPVTVNVDQTTKVTATLKK